MWRSQARAAPGSLRLASSVARSRDCDCDSERVGPLGLEATGDVLAGAALCGLLAAMDTGAGFGLPGCDGGGAGPRQENSSVPGRTGLAAGALRAPAGR